VALRALRVEGDRGPACRDPLFEKAPALGFRRVSTKPVIGACQLPGGVEAGRRVREDGGPGRRRLPRALEMRTVGVQRIR